MRRRTPLERRETAGDGAGVCCANGVCDNRSQWLWSRQRCGGRFDLEEGMIEIKLSDDSLNGGVKSNQIDKLAEHGHGIGLSGLHHTGGRYTGLSGTPSEGTSKFPQWPYLRS